MKRTVLIVAACVVGSVASCAVGDDASGRQAPAHLKLHFTLPKGWRRAPWDKSYVSARGVLVHKSTYFRGTMPLPAISMEIRTDDHLAEPPTGSAALLEHHEEVFAMVATSTHDATARRAGPCVLVDGERASRCVLHSAAPAARTVVGYLLYLDGRGVSMLFLSAETDEQKVFAESEPIVASVGNEP